MSNDSAAIATLRDELAASDYTEEGLTKLLGVGPEELWQIDARPSWPDPDDRLAVLTDLLLFSRTIAEHRAERILGASTVSALKQLRIVGSKGDQLRPRLNITPSRDLVLVGDVDRGQPDVVPAVYPASITTSVLTVRSPVQAALDLGTGSGVQALLAARHAERAVGVDINENAISLSRLNAELNEVANAEFRLGSWFEPVEDQRFGLIVGNPPYVVSPEIQRLYRDGGPDVMTRLGALVSDCAAHLTDGGYATLLLNWIHDPDAPWSAVPESWVSGIGCDAILLLYTIEEPHSYAQKFVAPRGRLGPGGKDTIERWTDWYRSEGIRSFAVGALVMRRREGIGHWIRSFEDNDRPEAGADAQIMRMFAGIDASTRLLDDKRLLDAAFCLVNGHRIDQALTYDAGAYSTHPPVMRIPGVGQAGKIDPEAAAVVLALDGHTHLGKIVRGVASDTGMERKRVQAAAVSTMRHLLERGYLELAS